MSIYKVAILTGMLQLERFMQILFTFTLVSDTAAKDGQQDRSGPVIKEILTDHTSGCRFSVDALVIVPDNVALIQSAVKGWTIGGIYDWIITTGGTGFGSRYMHYYFDGRLDVHLIIIPEI
jgi:molybdopterin biosynthesis enzyme MoaB